MIGLSLTYLVGHRLQASISNHISDKQNIKRGAPQGSVLGPLLFLLYINDICNSSKVLKLHLFADDTNILYSNKDLASLESVMNTELAKLQDWFSANNLTINIKKLKLRYF